MRVRRASATLLAVSVVAATVVACGGDDADDGAAPAATEAPVTETTSPAPESTESAEAPEPTTTTSTTTSSTTSTTTTTSLPVIDPPTPMPPEAPEGMELVWSDEFEADEIDLTNWTYDIGGWGWGNGEAQYYTDRPENARIENGMLVIELRQEKYEDKYYTSARLKTRELQEFQYGFIEARIKVPPGKGLWPAFWMLGTGFEQEAEDPNFRWPVVGEIDIMEYVGREPDLVIGTIHGPGYAGAGGKSYWNRLDFDVADDWHTFAVDWDETGIRWFFDGEQYAEVGPEDIGRGEWVFDKPFFMLLNMAIGGNLGGNIALDLEYPLRMYVDHVRVYQRVEG